MVKVKNFLLGTFLSIILLFAFIVSAAISTISPLDGTNHTSASLVLLNVSFVNNTDLLIFGTSQTQVNASFYSVNGSQITFLANSSSCGIVTSTNAACWTRFNVSGIDGFYNITSTLYNSTSSRNSSTNISSIYFDSTPPIVFGENFSNPLIGGNYSQNLVINLSAIDSTIGIQRVLFNITNSTNSQNATLIATLEAGTRYSATINTTGYPDGYYNITAQVNDSVNNLNNSATIYRIIFDNTLPAVSFTCDDYTVDEDDIMDCDCASSDALSGVANEEFDSTPSTSNTGNNQQSTCTVTDRAGNINRSTISYNVTGSSVGSSSSGSSSGSSGGTTTSSSTSGNSTNTNSTTTTQNTSSGEANQLEANQESQNGTNFKINYWILTIVLVGIGLTITAFILIKKGILQRLLKFNK